MEGHIQTQIASETQVGSKIAFEEDAEPAEKGGLKELVGDRNLKM